ncbi:MAG: hypothetical protein U0167_08145 [bacterium]
MSGAPAVTSTTSVGRWSATSASRLARLDVSLPAAARSTSP